MPTTAAHLRPSCTRLYLALDARWYRVVGEDALPHGYWLVDAGGDPFGTVTRPPAGAHG